MTSFIFIALVAVIIASSLASATTPIPSKVTECRSTSGQADFSGICNKIIANVTNAVKRKYSPGITAVAALFPPPFSQNRRPHRPPPVLGSARRGADDRHPRNVKLDFPGWSSATKVGIFSAGRYTYDDWSATADDAVTMYDLASVSKIVGSTTAAAVLYQMGILDLDMKLSDPKIFGPAFNNAGKGGNVSKDDITIRMLLSHTAGWYPDPVAIVDGKVVNRWFSSPHFRGPKGQTCPNNALFHPGQNFDCIKLFYDNLIYDQPLMYKPGTQYVYSDISMFALSYALSRIILANNHNGALIPTSPADWPGLCAGSDNVVTCPFYAFVRGQVFDRYGMQDTDYVPRDAMRTPPEWFSEWRHSRVMGYVSDENAYAQGGVSGNAGIFSTARDMAKWAAVWIDVQDPARINVTTIKTFFTRQNNFSCRLLGFNSNCDIVGDGDGDDGDGETRFGNSAKYPYCGNMSAGAGAGSWQGVTAMHRGYTGTTFCLDSASGLATVLLANGRFPAKQHDYMVWYRPQFASLVNGLFVG